MSLANSIFHAFEFYLFFFASHQVCSTSDRIEMHFHDFCFFNDLVPHYAIEQNFLDSDLREATAANVQRVC